MEGQKKDFIAYQFEVNEEQGANGKKDPLEDRIIMTKQFFAEDMFGSFFSCIFKGKLRIHIVLSDDRADYNTEILELINETIEKANIFAGKVWICNYNSEIITYLKKQLNIKRDEEPFLYESHEMIMPREKYSYRFDETLLNVRPYQEEHIDEYLSLLTKSMSFKMPPYNYVFEKDKFINYFEELRQKNAFEAFWTNDDLVGLYWIEGTEIDHLAVSPKYQHLGYGRQILSRAIEVSFQNPEIECAWLLVVGWNIQAFNFYKKFGMEERNVYYVPYSE